MKKKTTIRERIWDLLDNRHDGLTSREIARRLRRKRSSVSSILSKMSRRGDILTDPITRPFVYYP